jgi:hypothetical protein
VLAYAPLLLMLSALWPALYVRHRQPLVVAMKIWAAFVATLLPQQHAEPASSGAGGPPHGAMLAHAGSSLASQLVLHALGLQTTGAWLILSQGFAVAASARLADQACEEHLAGVVRRLLQERPGLLSRPWLLGAAAVSADPSLVCKAYTLGMQIVVGYCATTALALLAEWRQRRAFAAKWGADQPCGWSLAALAGCYLSMLLLLLRIALATVLPPAAAYAAAAGSCPAGAAVAGTCTVAA